MKKRVFLLLSLFMTIIGAKADEVTFSVQDFSIEPGETKEISLIMTTTPADKRFNFGGEMILSEGLTFVSSEVWDEDEEENVTKYVLRTGRLHNKHDLDEHLKAPNDVTFLISSGTKYYGYKEGDAVLTFKVKAAENMALGTASVQLKGMNASGEEAVDLVTEPDYTATVTVTKKVSVSVVSADETKGTVTGSGSYNSGSEVTVTATPTTGYEFVNWTKGEDEASKVNPYVFTVTEDVSLTANFKATTYTITYVLDEEAEIEEGNPTTYTIETETFTLKNPTKTGYTFVGWLKEGEETPSTEVSIVRGTTGDLKFTAQWTINQYTITFMLDNGQENIVMEQNYGTAITAPANPTKEGYTFTGWDKDVPATMPAENVTLTAQWTINEYTMTFVLDNGQENVVKTQNYGTELTAPENVTKTGYSFSGWSPEVPATVPAEDKTFTAQWTINQYTITFDSNGGTAVADITQDYGTAITAPANPTKEGYTFAGWDKDVPATMPAENVTLTAQWTPVTYSISYDLDGGSVATANPATYTIESNAITLVNPTKDGYEFAGWTGTDLTQATMTVTIAKGSIGNRTYTATWTPASGIRAIFRDSKTVNVYTVNGTLVGRDKTIDEVIQLKHGVYVINGKKIAIK